MRAAVTLGLWLGLCAAAAAAPRDDLAAARDAFRRGDCASAVPALNVLLYPAPRLAAAADLGEAHLLYAACLVGAGDATGAAREFEEALFVAPELTVDPLLFSEDVRRAFDQAKAAAAVRTAQEAEARALAEERERLRRYRDSLIVYEQRPYYLNFVPGGAGQFQRGATGLGLFFAASQLATAATSAGIWIYLVQTYGYGGTVPREDAAFARRLQQIEIGTGVAFLGLVAWGVVDSLYHHKPRVKVEGDDSLLPPDAAPQPKAALAPFVAPGGGGLALAVTY